jgi:hypothetical protein
VPPRDEPGSRSHYHREQDANENGPDYFRSFFSVLELGDQEIIHGRKRLSDRPNAGGALAPGIFMEIRHFMLLVRTSMHFM